MMNKIISFKVIGKFAHFKKYYTNSSSLTYEIPTRTNIMGMLASILCISRDDYYDLFCPDICKLSVSLLSKVKKHFECMNYIHPDKNKALHTQTRLELLMPVEKFIEYEIFVLLKDENKHNELLKKLNNFNVGYGLYFGQRQFRVFLKEKPIEYEFEKINNLDEIVNIETITWSENLVDFSDNSDFISLNMVNNYKKIKNGREPLNISNILFSKNNHLNGKFQEIIRLKNGKNISFFTPLNF